MRILILSDIHANLVALDAVLADCGDVDAIWNLGDTVGYGPRPSECLDRMQAIGADPILAGNHDLACSGELDDRDFNAVARAASRWTADRLNVAQKLLLRSLPLKTETCGVTLTHGSPRDPIWEYVTSEHVAIANFSRFSTNVCFVGHSHLPLVFRLASCAAAPDMQGLADQQVVMLDEARFIINPGSVGQPRDHDARAAYGILDLGRGEFIGKRVEYDVEETQSQMKEAGLPEFLINRLSIGH